jgi:hypothetical protein
MTGFSERGIGNWVYSAYGLVFPMPPDLAGRVKRTVPNRADRRHATRTTTAATREARTAGNRRIRIESGS